MKCLEPPPVRVSDTGSVGYVPKTLTPKRSRRPKFMGQGSRWPDLKVLVTGGSGFIGWHLCRRLCEEGSEVHATSRRQHPTARGGPIWWQADMAELSTARRVLAAIRPDIVFHLAGSVGAAPDLELVSSTYQSLLTSSVNVLMRHN